MAGSVLPALVDDPLPLGLGDVDFVLVATLAAAVTVPILNDGQVPHRPGHEKLRRSDRGAAGRMRGSAGRIRPPSQPPSTPMSNAWALAMTTAAGVPSGMEAPSNQLGTVAVIPGAVACNIPRITAAATPTQEPYISAVRLPAPAIAPPTIWTISEISQVMKVDCISPWLVPLPATETKSRITCARWSRRSRRRHRRRCGATEPAR